MKNISTTYKGVITGTLMIVLSLLFFYIMKLPANGKNQYIILIVFIAGILWSLISFKLNGPPTLTIKNYFSEGFKTFIVVTLFMAVFTFIFYKLNPQIMENGILENNALILKDGNKTPAEINENADKMRSIFIPMMLAINTIKYLLLGTLISIIAGGFLSQPKR